MRVSRADRINRVVEESRESRECRERTGSTVLWKKVEKVEHSYIIPQIVSHHWLVSQARESNVQKYRNRNTCTPLITAERLSFNSRL